MVYSEGAKLIGAEELKDIIDEEYTNPTIERLMFIETKESDHFVGKVFPCYLEAWGEEPKENADVKSPFVDEEKPKLVFQCCIAQCKDGNFSLIRVVLHEDELGVTKRIWDKAPNKSVREEHPWLEKPVQ